MRILNIKIIASILLFTCGILFFSLAVQKYQVLTSSQATLNLPQCEIPEGSDTPTTLPCASCTIFNDTSVDDTGNVNVEFGCQVVCNASGNPLDTTGCPSGALPYSISETSWYWCKTAGTHACTSQNELTGDLITNIESSGFAEGGPWIMSRQGETKFTADFNVPGYESCGRIQMDIETNQKYSYVYNSEVDCDDTIVAQDVGTNIPATPTIGFGFPDESPTNTPMVIQPTLPPPTSTRTPTPSPSPSRTPSVTISPLLTTTLTTTPTGTITPSISTTPGITGSITPTGSLSPSPTLTPTETPTPTPTATFTPTPTFTPIPTPPTEIAINGEPPGITSWFIMLVPVGLVLLGLLL